MLILYCQFITKFMNDSAKQNSPSYKDAGVDIDAGNQLVENIKPLVKKTLRAEVMGGLGGFGGLCQIPSHYKNPVLVSCTDGVGTKLRLAMDLQLHQTIGIDLVAMCVNDLIVSGAEPLFFLDYYATGKLNVDVATDVVSGISDGCQQANCALIGGETAEMPGMYHGSDYDLAGFCVGVVEKDNIIDGSNIQAGDQLIGLASSGFHSNGYSLIRKIIKDNNIDLSTAFLDSTLGQHLLTPTKIYVNTILNLIKKFEVKALAHITGGGLLENIPRVIPEQYRAVIDANSWPQLPIYDWLKEQTHIAPKEMFRTFNSSIGMVLCVAENDCDNIINFLQRNNEDAWHIGNINTKSNTDSPIDLVGL